MSISNFVSFTHKEYLTLGNYLIEKHPNDDKLYSILEEILKCFDLNMNIGKEINRECNYNPKVTNNPVSIADKIFKAHLEEQIAIHSKFREKYKKLKKLLGKDGIKFTAYAVTLKKSFISHYITVDDLNATDLPTVLKKKLYSTISEKERVEKSMYNKISKKFKHDRIVKQYRVEHRYGVYKIDFYFIDCKVAVEIDEWGHQGYYGDKRRQDYIEKKLHCVFVRFNPFGNETIEDFLKRLERVISKQKKKYQHSFSERTLKKLEHLAYANNCTVDKILREIIDDYYSKNNI